LRLKEGKWLGVACDALAAHVWPAMLAVSTAAHLGVRMSSRPLVLSLLAWSGAAGVRGILSHQLHTAERDRLAGLVTVVHDFGRLPLERFITRALLPIELCGFVAAITLCDVGPALVVFGGLYLACEAFKALAGGFEVTAFRPQGQLYIPFVEESFYKGWGPFVIAADAARHDARFLLVALGYLLLFRPHVYAELRRLRAVAGVLRQGAPST
ncbi:MAG TPA: hypothetical protein VFH51_07910, partial [Myxococcota bacterium]|nr:hypothetical protein [Myxococcota bacterium]